MWNCICDLLGFRRRDNGDNADGGKADNEDNVNEIGLVEIQHVATDVTSSTVTPRAGDIPPGETGLSTATPTVTPHVGNMGGENPNPYRKYGLRSPPRGVNAQELSEAEDLIRRDGFGKCLKKYAKKVDDTDFQNKTKCLVFLYGRGFHLHSKTKRTEKITKILNKSSAIKRCLRLLDSDGADRDRTADDFRLYKRNCLILHRYFQQKDSFGFLPDGNSNATYYFRIQLQGNCFMHAPCVVIPYLFQHRGVKDVSVHPVDLSKFVRRSFTDKELYHYIYEDDGGKAIHFLTRMLESLFKPSKACIDSDSCTTVSNKKYKLKERLEDYGPGIVTGFDCNKHFKNMNSDENSEKIGYLQFQGRHSSKAQFIDLPDQDDEDFEGSIETTLNEYLNAQNADTSDDQQHDTRRSSLAAFASAEEEKVEMQAEEEKMSVEGGRVAVEATVPGTESAVTDEEAVENAESDCATGLDGGKREEESHAMLVIGGRRKGRKLFLLLQNWWVDMQLVEVDAEYFRGTQASLSFVGHEKKEFEAAVEKLNNGSFYDMNSSLVAESALDRADYYGREEGCFPSNQQRDRE